MVSETLMKCFWKTSTNEACYMRRCLKRLSLKYCFVFLHGWAYAVVQSVEALRYKPEARGFNSR